jgi:hypothetical protein
LRRRKTGKVERLEKFEVRSQKLEEREEGRRKAKSPSSSMLCR